MEEKCGGGVHLSLLPLLPLRVSMASHRGRCPAPWLAPGTPGALEEPEHPQHLRRRQQLLHLLLPHGHLDTVLNKPGARQHTLPL